MDMKNRYKGGYDALMGHISVTPEMAARIARSLRREDSLRKRHKRGYRAAIIGLAACATAAVLCFTLLPGVQQQPEGPGHVLALPPESFETIDEAAAQLSFAVRLPAGMPEGYTLSGCTIYDGSMLELIYSNDAGACIAYRTAEGADDLSGDYRAYAVEATVQSSAGIPIALKGEASGYRVAVWTDAGLTYSLCSDAALAEADMLRIIDSTQAYAP